MIISYKTQRISTEYQNTKVTLKLKMVVTEWQQKHKDKPFLASKYYTIKPTRDTNFQT